MCGAGDRERPAMHIVFVLAVQVAVDEEIQCVT